ncbi:MAG TPA: sulfotransferase domain-containing protein [Anaerolineales bacterium]|nr:sulfotransferase domain-containing protein [Anaerolineales bacterium]
MWRHRHLSLNHMPILFANSFPKSGTHLLTQVLHGFTRLGAVVDSGLPAIATYEGDSGRERPVEDMLADLQRLNPGDIAYGHLHALPALVSFLCREGVAPYFILRDPRDVVVSHVHYVTEMALEHVHHSYYTEVLRNFDERLQTSILGRPDWQDPFPDIRARFDPYLTWLDRQEVLTLSFEEFVADKAAAIGRVLDHAVNRGFPVSTDRAQAVQQLAAGIEPERSPTFRSGRVGGWRERFTPEHKELFKKVAGDLLIRLGYERSNDW